jgi:hypothetical protein
MTTPRTPTQRNISAVLANARHIKSVSSPSRIKGLRNHSDGFVVLSGYDGAVWVRHEVVSMRTTQRDLERIAERLAMYARVIEEAGYAVERGSDRLIVTAKAV